MLPHLFISPPEEQSKSNLSSIFWNSIYKTIELNFRVFLNNREPWPTELRVVNFNISRRHTGPIFIQLAGEILRGLPFGRLKWMQSRILYPDSIQAFLLSYIRHVLHLLAIMSWRQMRWGVDGWWPTELLPVVGWWMMGGTENNTLPLLLPKYII